MSASIKDLDLEFPTMRLFRSVEDEPFPQVAASGKMDTRQPEENPKQVSVTTSSTKKAGARPPPVLNYRLKYKKSVDLTTSIIGGDGAYTDGGVPKPLTPVAYPRKGTADMFRSKTPSSSSTSTTSAWKIASTSAPLSTTATGVKSRSLGGPATTSALSGPQELQLPFRKAITPGRVASTSLLVPSGSSSGSPSDSGTVPSDRSRRSAAAQSEMSLSSGASSSGGCAGHVSSAGGGPYRSRSVSAYNQQRIVQPQLSLKAPVFPGLGGPNNRPGSLLRTSSAKVFLFAKAGESERAARQASSSDHLTTGDEDTTPMPAPNKEDANHIVDDTSTAGAAPVLKDEGESSALSGDAVSSPDFGIKQAGAYSGGDKKSAGAAPPRTSSSKVARIKSSPGPSADESRKVVTSGPPQPRSSPSKSKNRISAGQPASGSGAASSTSIQGLLQKAQVREDGRAASVGALTRVGPSRGSLSQNFRAMQTPIRHMQASLPFKFTALSGDESDEISEKTAADRQAGSVPPLNLSGIHGNKPPDPLVMRMNIRSNKPSKDAPDGEPPNPNVEVIMHQQQQEQASFNPFQWGASLAIARTMHGMGASGLLGGARGGSSGFAAPAKAMQLQDASPMFEKLPVVAIDDYATQLRAKLTQGLVPSAGLAATPTGATRYASSVPSELQGGAPSGGVDNRSNNLPQAPHQRFSRLMPPPCLHIPPPPRFRPPSVSPVLAQHNNKPGDPLVRSLTPGGRLGGGGPRGRSPGPMLVSPHFQPAGRSGGAVKNENSPLQSAAKPSLTMGVAPANSSITKKSIEQVRGAGSFTTGGSSSSTSNPYLPRSSTIHFAPSNDAAEQLLSDAATFIPSQTAEKFKRQMGGDDFRHKIRHEGSSIEPKIEAGDDKRRGTIIATTSSQPRTTKTGGGSPASRSTRQNKGDSPKRTFMLTRSPSPATRASCQGSLKIGSPSPLDPNMPATSMMGRCSKLSKYSVSAFEELEPTTTLVTGVLDTSKVPIWGISPKIALRDPLSRNGSKKSRKSTKSPSLEGHRRSPSVQLRTRKTVKISADAQSITLEDEVDEDAPTATGKAASAFKSSVPKRAIRRLSEASIRKICGFTSLNHNMVTAAAALSCLDNEDEIGSLLLELDCFAKVERLDLLKDVNGLQMADLITSLEVYAGVRHRGEFQPHTDALALPDGRRIQWPDRAAIVHSNVEEKEELRLAMEGDKKARSLRRIQRMVRRWLFLRRLSDYVDRIADWREVLTEMSIAELRLSTAIRIQRQYRVHRARQRWHDTIKLRERLITQEQEDARRERAAQRERKRLLELEKKRAKEEEERQRELARRREEQRKREEEERKRQEEERQKQYEDMVVRRVQRMYRSRKLRQSILKLVWGAMDLEEEVKKQRKLEEERLAEEKRIEEERLRLEAEKQAATEALRKQEEEARERERLRLEEEERQRKAREAAIHKICVWWSRRKFRTRCSLVLSRRTSLSAMIVAQQIRTREKLRDDAAKKLQGWWRKYICYKTFRKKWSYEIHVRGLRTRMQLLNSNFDNKKFHAVKIQQWWRSYRLRVAWRQRMVPLINGVREAKVAKRKEDRRNRCATAIQRSFRIYSFRQCVQRGTHGPPERRLTARAAAIIALERHEYESMIAKKLQSRWRLKKLRDTIFASSVGAIDLEGIVRRQYEKEAQELAERLEREQRLLEARCGQMLTHWWRSTVLRVLVTNGNFARCVSLQWQTEAVRVLQHSFRDGSIGRWRVSKKQEALMRAWKEEQRLREIEAFRKEREERLHAEQERLRLEEEERLEQLERERLEAEEAERQLQLEKEERERQKALAEEARFRELAAQEEERRRREAEEENRRRKEAEDIREAEIERLQQRRSRQRTGAMRDAWNKELEDAAADRRTREAIEVQELEEAIRKQAANEEAMRLEAERRAAAQATADAQRREEEYRLSEERAKAKMFETAETVRQSLAGVAKRVVSKKVAEDEERAERERMKVERRERYDEETKRKTEKGRRLIDALNKTADDSKREIARSRLGNATEKARASAHELIQRRDRVSAILGDIESRAVATDKEERAAKDKEKHDRVTGLLHRAGNLALDQGHEKIAKKDSIATLLSDTAHAESQRRQSEKERLASLLHGAGQRVLTGAKAKLAERDRVASLLSNAAAAEKERVEEHRARIRQSLRQEKVAEAGQRKLTRKSTVAAMLFDTADAERRRKQEERRRLGALFKRGNAAAVEEALEMLAEKSRLLKLLCSTADGDGLRTSNEQRERALATVEETLGPKAVLVAIQKFVEWDKIVKMLTETEDAERARTEAEAQKFTSFFKQGDEDALLEVQHMLTAKDEQAELLSSCTQDVAEKRVRDEDNALLTALFRRGGEYALKKTIELFEKRDEAGLAMWQHTIQFTSEDGKASASQEEIAESVESAKAHDRAKIGSLFNMSAESGMTQAREMLGDKIRVSQLLADPATQAQRRRQRLRGLLRASENFAAHPDVSEAVAPQQRLAVLLADHAAAETKRREEERARLYGISKRESQAALVDIQRKFEERDRAAELGSHAGRAEVQKGLAAREKLVEMLRSASRDVNGQEKEHFSGLLKKAGMHAQAEALQRIEDKQRIAQLLNAAGDAVAEKLVHDRERFAELLRADSDQDLELDDAPVAGEEDEEGADATTTNTPKSRTSFTKRASAMLLAPQRASSHERFQALLTESGRAAAEAKLEEHERRVELLKEAGERGQSEDAEKAAAGAYLGSSASRKSAAAAYLLTPEGQAEAAKRRKENDELADVLLDAGLVASAEALRKMHDGPGRTQLLLESAAAEEKRVGEERLQLHEIARIAIADEHEHNRAHAEDEERRQIEERDTAVRLLKKAGMHKEAEAVKAMTILPVLEDSAPIPAKASSSTKRDEAAKENGDVEGPTSTSRGLESGPMRTPDTSTPAPAISRGQSRGEFVAGPAMTNEQIARILHSASATLRAHAEEEEAARKEAEESKKKSARQRRSELTQLRLLEHAEASKESAEKKFDKLEDFMKYPTAGSTSVLRRLSKGATAASSGAEGETLGVNVEPHIARAASSSSSGSSSSGKDDEAREQEAARVAGVRGKLVQALLKSAHTGGEVGTTDIDDLIRELVHHRLESRTGDRVGETEDASAIHDFVDPATGLFRGDADKTVMAQTSDEVLEILDSLENEFTSAMAVKKLVREHTKELRAAAARDVRVKKLVSSIVKDAATTPEKAGGIEWNAATAEEVTTALGHGLRLLRMKIYTLSRWDQELKQKTEMTQNISQIQQAIKSRASAMSSSVLPSAALYQQRLSAASGIPTAGGNSLRASSSTSLLAGGVGGGPRAALGSDARVVQNAGGQELRRPRSGGLAPSSGGGASPYGGTSVGIVSRSSSRGSAQGSPSIRASRNVAQIQGVRATIVVDPATRQSIAVASTSSAVTTSTGSVVKPSIGASPKAVGRGVSLAAAGVTTASSTAGSSRPGTSLTGPTSRTSTPVAATASPSSSTAASRPARPIVLNNATTASSSSPTPSMAARFAKAAAPPATTAPSSSPSKTTKLTPAGGSAAESSPSSRSAARATRAPAAGVSSPSSRVGGAAARTAVAARTIPVRPGAAGTAAKASPGPSSSGASASSPSRVGAATSKALAGARATAGARTAVPKFGMSHAKAASPTASRSRLPTAAPSTGTGSGKSSPTSTAKQRAAK
ncbi:unnamed protein product [Amoebophrya sp. A25]|nr:unnamed protein product [Amoebophrya sp. A25]|eukprot:GSA25T00000262001.1